MFRYHASSLRIAKLANFNRYIEIQCFDLTAALMCHFDERLAIAAGEICGINISHWPLQLDAPAQEISHGGEDGSVDCLICLIIG